MLLALVIAGALAATGDVERGRVLAGVAGCASCHTAADGPDYAGGYELDTPWGVFYGSNLTPDVATGLGAWTYDDFVRAMRKGRSPKGRPYYPSFPYTAFTGITDEDLADLWAYLQSLEPVERSEERHALRGLNGWRFLLRFWKVSGFRVGPLEAERGEYLSEAVAHCSECHTPRGGLGVPRRGKAYAGTDAPPEPAPNITPSAEGIGAWSVGDLASFLGDGMEPDGNVTGGEMRRLVEHGTALLTAKDRRAIAAWILSHPPLDDRGRPSTTPIEDADDDDDWDL